MIVYFLGEGADVQVVKYRRFVTRARTQDKLMLCVTRMSWKEHWREGCFCLAVEFKYQQAFSRIADYTFKRLVKHQRYAL